MRLLFSTILSVLLFPHFTLAQAYIGATATEQNKATVYLSEIYHFSSDRIVATDSLEFLYQNGAFAKLSETNIINLGYSNTYHWFRFSISNRSSQSYNYRLIAGSNLLSKASLYRQQQTKAIHLSTTGLHVPYKQRTDPSFAFHFPIQIEASSSSSYFLFADARGHTLQLVLLLLPTHTFNAIEKKTYLVYGFFTAALVLASLFNLFLFYFLKDKVHLYYSLYAISNSLLILSFRNFDHQYFYPDLLFAAYVNRVTYSCLSMFLCIAVMQQFLQQQKSNSRFFALTNSVKWVSLVMIPLNLVLTALNNSFFSSFKMWLFFGIMLAGLLLILLSSIEKVKQGSRYALFYLVAISFFVTGGIKVLLINLRLSDAFEMPPNLFETGLVIETIVIFLGILYRYNLFKIENDQLNRDLQRARQETFEQVLFAQEAEQKRIAADLHDELGGNLAAIKMTVASFGLAPKQSELVNTLLDETSQAARNISHNLMPPGFEITELEVLLSNYYKRLQQETGVSFQFYSSGTNKHFNKQSELMIYRICMELTHNIIKHACANEATVQLLYYEQYVELMAEDNGKGIPEHPLEGMGLQNVRLRVSYLNGTMQTDSGPGGTTIILQIPYPLTNEQTN